MNTYVVSTLAYGGVAILGLLAMTLTILDREWLLFVVAVLAVLVALDNFFCGLRARVSGCSVEGHYVIPPFLRFGK